VTLTSTGKPSYMNWTRIPLIYTGCAKMNVLRQGCQKLSHKGQRLHEFSNMWSLPVTWQRWWSHHLIRRSWKPRLHANLMALSVTEVELWAIKVLHCGNRNFRPFCLLWPWTWPDDLYIRIWPVLPRDTWGMQIWASCIKTFESYCLTYRRTDKLHVVTSGNAIKMAVTSFNPP